ncbi:MAG: class I SAM-dependent methyltransferase [Betaproteobacteria bacterium]
MGPLVAVTTTHEATESATRVARHIAERYGWPFVARTNASLPGKTPWGERRHWIVVGQAGARLVACEGASFAFHPGLAVVRIKRLLAGQWDPLIGVTRLCPGDSFLDCTVGLAQDSIVASHAVGEAGQVRGLEAAPEVAAVVEAGLQVYRYPDPAVETALRKVEIVPTRHEQYLASLPAGSWDVVYFDPMFRRPVSSSDGIAELRRIAMDLPVSPGAVAEARRVARRLVVLKERVGSPEFARLGFAVAWRGHRVALGVIEA